MTSPTVAVRTRPTVPGRTLAAVTTSPATPAPPIAERRPHTWARPSGAAEDPYAWLRDRDDPATIAYLEAENTYADAWFAERSGLVDAIYEEIRSRVQETDESVPVPHGPWWYVTRMVEGQSYPIFCRGRSIEDATADVIVDANAEAEGHDFFDVHTVEPSPDHRLLAWSSDVDGGERYTLRVRDLATGEDLDVIEGTSSWGGVAWSADGTWLFYARPDEQMRPFEIWRHRLGSPVADDELVHTEPDERFTLGVGATRSTAWIVLGTSSRTSSEAWLVPGDDPTSAPRLVRARAADVEYDLDHWGDRFVVVTNLGAPDFRVMTAPIDAPDDWAELLPHEPGRRITGVEPFDTHLVVHEWRDAQPQVRVLWRDGRVEVVDFGAEPHDLGLGANLEWATTTLRLTHQSLTAPASVWDVDLATGQRTLRKRTPTPGVDLDAYTSSRVWATAADGTSLPIDVAHHVGTPLDGTAPCVIYGYGSYEAALAPWFSPARISLLDRGFTWVLVHPRGGGELGRQWYLGGKLLAKRNTFTDTLDSSEHVAAAGIGDPDRLALRGGSAGGLLVGACVNMRPDLYRAAVAEVPFVDVVTTMSDVTLPLTAIEWEEWGDPREEPWASYMLGYSPYDNVVPGDYPAIYVTAGLNDPRVSFHEPAKWTAKLRASGAGRDPSRPLLLRTNMGAGHGGPSGRYEAWRDEARVLAFLVAQV
jgi:oligopeptidase B